MREMSEIVETLFEMEGVSNVCGKIFYSEQIEPFSLHENASLLLAPTGALIVIMCY